MLIRSVTYFVVGVFCCLLISRIFISNVYGFLNKAFKITAKVIGDLFKSIHEA